MQDQTSDRTLLLKPTCGKWCMASMNSRVNSAFHPLVAF